MNAISVKLDVFDGPLDLLLHLIEINKIDIFDIPISEIADQYLEAISGAREKDMDSMSEFLVMAALLLKIKSNMLLPARDDGEEEGVDPRTELVERLLEYKTYKYASYELRDMQAGASQKFFKKPAIPDSIMDFRQTPDVGELLSDVSLGRLQKIFNDAVKKQSDRVDPIRSRFGQIKRENVKLEERIVYIEEYAKRRREFSFREMLENDSDKNMVVATFLGILELMKAGKLKASQEFIFDDIWISYVEGQDQA